MAQEGNTDAQAHLGVLYAKGQGVPQEYQRAKRWLRIAARKGSPSAQYNLGVLYTKAQGLGRSDQKYVARWFRKAAVQGHAGAQFNLGCLYAMGDGVPWHHAQAVKWINLAAAAGYKDTKEASDLWEMCWASEHPEVQDMRTPTKVFIGGIVAFTLLILNVSVGDGSASPQAPRQLPQESLGKDGAPMRLVPAGEFTMGSNDGGEAEKPQHRVYVDAFYMDKFEVTTSQYARFLTATGRKEPRYWSDVRLVNDGDRPVVGVTWHDANTYCRHYGKRLPTEAEWEKAARGTDERTYPWGNQEPSRSRASYDWDGTRVWKGYRTVSASGSHQSGKSPYSVHDMAGNVWEWVADWHDDGYYKNSPNRNPKGPSSGNYKVLRGGSWFDLRGYLRSAYRFGAVPSARGDDIGFRCLQDIPK